MVYFPQGAIRIYPETMAEAFENKVDRAVTMQDRLEKEIAINTLPSEYWPSMYDRGVHLREETWMEFVKWRMMGEEDQTVEYVKMPGSVGIMVPAKGREHAANIAGVIINDSIIELNIRDIGKYLSLQHNFREHLMDYMRSDEGQALATFLNKLGHEADDIEYTAIGFVPESAIYAIGRLPNGKVVIYANKDAYKKIDREAEAFGMKENEMREVAIGEEITHLFRRSNPSIMEEKATKETLLRFYETLAKATSNPKLKAKYGRIMGHLKHDISTVARYAKINSSLESLVGLYDIDVGELVSVLEAKAMYEGINTSEGIEKYVDGKLEEIAKAADKEYSGDAKISEYTKEESSDGESAEGEACAEADGGEGGDGGGE